MDIAQAKATIRTPRPRNDRRRGCRCHRQAKLAGSGPPRAKSIGSSSGNRFAESLAASHSRVIALAPNSGFPSRWFMATSSASVSDAQKPPFLLTGAVTVLCEAGAGAKAGMRREMLGPDGTGLVPREAGGMLRASPARWKQWEPPRRWLSYGTIHDP